MKSDTCVITNESKDLNRILEEVEKCTAFNGLNKKQALHIRLLAEELVGMLPELAEICDGIFWVECVNNLYELHVQAKIPQAGTAQREQLLSVSKTGRNAAAKGLMGKIYSITEIFMRMEEDSENHSFASCNVEELYYMNVVTPTSLFDKSWSLNDYVEQIDDDRNKEQGQIAWDELEKSIVKHLADDVIVGIRGKQVDIIVKKQIK